MEFVQAGEKLQDCRTAFLDRVAHAKKVLILGKGNGRFLAGMPTQAAQRHKLCAWMPKRFKSLASARKRANIPGHNSDDIKFIHADALTWAPAGERYRFISSPISSWICFRPEQVLKLLIAKSTLVAAPRANWLLWRIFERRRPASNGSAHESSLWMMYRFFRVATRLPAKRLTPPDALLRSTRL